MKIIIIKKRSFVFWNYETLWQHRIKEEREGKERKETPVITLQMTGSM